jgi:integrase
MTSGFGVVQAPLGTVYTRTGRRLFTDDTLAPHDPRRACARLCHAAGGELEQIQFLLGHVSIQTTERYLGCKQRIRSAVNDRIGIEFRGEP